MRMLLFLFIIVTVSYLCNAQNNYPVIKVTEDIELIKISDNSYIHVSYFRSPQYGRFPSNGFLYANKGKAFLFDTPMTDSLTELLINYIINSLKLEIVGFVPNHWHNDCMEGLDLIQEIGIKSYSCELTREIAKSKGLPVPDIGFSDSLILKLGDKEIICKFYGAAHTLDNIIVWFPDEQILFGGCMIRSINSRNLGNTADGDLTEYPKTIEKVLKVYQDAKIVIPGHGPYGGIELIENTLRLATQN